MGWLSRSQDGRETMKKMAGTTFYSVERAGSRPKRRIGHLFRKGVRLKGKVGETIDTPFGQLRYFGKDDPKNMSDNHWLAEYDNDGPTCV